ncbi:MAG: hypothetical protein HY238_20425, partial [Acidobacteria bacterium]|nr:hypothetical protein [Acidobacteriota bacterium]
MPQEPTSRQAAKDAKHAQVFFASLRSLASWRASWRGIPLLFLLAAAAPAQNDTLGPAARKFMETGSPAAREALLRLAGGSGPDAPLARLVLGIGDYQDKKFPAAVEQLREANPAELADYAVYYRGLVSAAAQDHAAAARELADFARRFPASPLGAGALAQRADSLSLSGQAKEALALLAGAPDSTPSALSLLARVAERAGDAVRAAQFYQRIYYEFPTSPEQSQALPALNALRAKLGARYPQPKPAWRLGRADRLAAAQKYVAARTEYRTLSLRLKGLLKEQALVRIGVCDYSLKANLRAYRWLKSLKLTEPEAVAERLYYIGACARRLKRQQEVTDSIAELGRQLPQSRWHEQALFAAGNSFLVENAPEQYVRYYRTLAETFPKTPQAAVAHWKIAWRACLEQRAEARALLEDHVRLYPSSPQLTAALYWIARLAEAASDPATARACYEFLSSRYPNYYYALLARDRLGKLHPPSGPAPDSVVRLLGGIPAAPPLPAEAPADWAPLLRRARLLYRLGLADLGERELRFRADSAPRFAYRAGLELAEQAAERGNYHRAIRYLKRYVPAYLAYPLDAMPRRFWELLFPLPWRDQIEAYSR